ncbi:MAG: biotin/lipoyl-binding protein [Desulfurococcales archaeon]|nr:biotin/lipoyl-binding protein [Desulfurococcales archaeon]
MARVEVKVPETLWGRRSRWDGVVVAVHVGPGSRVRAGDPIAEVEVDKAIVVVESPYDGIVVEVTVSEGDRVGPGSLLAVMEVEAEGEA